MRVSFPWLLTKPVTLPSTIATCHIRNSVITINGVRCLCKWIHNFPKGFNQNLINRERERKRQREGNSQPDRDRDRRCQLSTIT